MNGLGVLLWPLSILYGAIVWIRAWCYRAGIFHSHRLKKPVISVGNLTTGGTGKTPLVIYIAERLREEGKQVGILIRGYKGGSSLEAPRQRSSSERRIRSDEADMLENRLDKSVRLGIGADRVASGRALEDWADFSVLDDGFQHLRLARDVDIVLIDSMNPFGGGRLLPAGRLREPKGALARANIVVITRTEHARALELVVRRYSQAPIFYANTCLDWIAPAAPGGEAGVNRDPNEIRMKFFAFCGIGNPEAFFLDLRRWGLQIVGEAVYPDHHRYSRRNSEVLERDALSAGADALLCTEKDIFNLTRAEFQRFPVYYCRISLHVKDSDGFWQSLQLALGDRNLREPA